MIANSNFDQFFSDFILDRKNNCNLIGSHTSVEGKRNKELGARCIYPWSLNPASHCAHICSLYLTDYLHAKAARLTIRSIEKTGGHKRFSIDTTNKSPIVGCPDNADWRSIGVANIHPAVKWPVARRVVDAWNARICRRAIFNHCFSISTSRFIIPERHAWKARVCFMFASVRKVKEYRLINSSPSPLRKSAHQLRNLEMN